MDPAPIFRVEGVTKSFGGFRALQGVSLSVARGEIRAVIGPNGAGKTTLVHIVSGLLTATSGRIFLSDRDITRMSAHRRARLGLARTFQITSLFCGLTVAEHVRLAMRGANRRNGAVSRRCTDQTLDLLRDVGLEGEADHVIETLSHGDQKLLEVTMALAANPYLLLLDEPTAGMSVAETTAMIQLINQRLRGQVSVIIIEHDMNVVMQTADRITVLANGGVVGEGPPEHIMRDPGVRKVYLGTADRA